MSVLPPRCRAANHYHIQHRSRWLEHTPPESHPQHVDENRPRKPRRIAGRCPSSRCSPSIVEGGSQHFCVGGFTAIHILGLSKRFPAAGRLLPVSTSWRRSDEATVPPERSPYRCAPDRDGSARRALPDFIQQPSRSWSKRLLTKKGSQVSSPLTVHTWPRTPASPTAQAAAKLAAEAERSQVVLESQGDRRLVQTTLRSKRATLLLTKVNLGYTKISAPGNGEVGERQVRPGQLVFPGGARWISFVDRARRVQAEIKKKQLPKVTHEQTIQT